MGWKYYKPIFDYEKKYKGLESAWIGHRYFTYDLIRNVKPKTIVELGTHKGGSLFSFCQSVKDGQLNTKLFAIDTWSGDKHTGSYDQNMFAQVKNIKHELYPKQNIKLIKKTFDQAVDLFPDQSIDLLHVDGLHTYQAVKKDFQNWFPKVSQNGIIIIHDIHEKKDDFQVYRLWNQLKKQYTTIDFSHAHGLGVIVLTKSRLLKHKSFFDIWPLYYKNIDQNKQFKQLIDDKDRHIENLESIKNQDKKLQKHIQIQTNKILKIEKDLAFIKSPTQTNLYNLFEKQLETITSLQKQIKKKCSLINIQNQKIKDMDQHIDNLQNILNQITTAKTFKAWQIFTKIKNYSKKQPKTLVKKFFDILSQKGVKYCQQLILSESEKITKINNLNHQYQIWRSLHTTSLLKQKKEHHNLNYRPKISIITPVYNTDPIWLKKCLDSVLNQTYNNWELCLADDASTQPHVKQILKTYSKNNPKIKTVFRRKNGHISKASNSALKLATGDFVALLDHDDELAPHALYQAIKLLNLHKDADLIYSDEDKIDMDGEHVEPFFKPDWSPDMLLSCNYLCHLTLIRKKLVDKVGKFRSGYEGSQDYDLFLRCTKNTNKIFHIPDILYSWRKVPESTASTYSVKDYANKSALKAIKDYLIKTKTKATVKNGIVPGTFRVKRQIRGIPKIDIIIPTKDKISYLKRCVDSVIEKTTYQNYHINIVDTGSVESQTQNYYQKLKNNPKISILKWQKPFNFAAVNNYAVSKVKGKYVLLLNNDTEIINKGWLKSMLEQAQRPEVGAVGAKLLYPNYKIQHAGIILGIRGGPIRKGIAGHSQKTFFDSPSGLPLWNSKDIIRNFSAVTAACLMINRTKYLQVNGMNEKFRIAFNDVDFCLKLRQAGFLNVYTPFARLFHHESISVGTPQNQTRNITEFQHEIKLMHQTWGETLQHDPYYNRNLDLQTEYYEIKTN